jgi:hypothetical protein
MHNRVRVTPEFDVIDKAATRATDEVRWLNRLFVIHWRPVVNAVVVLGDWLYRRHRIDDPKRLVYPELGRSCYNCRAYRIYNAALPKSSTAVRTLLRRAAC